MIGLATVHEVQIGGTKTNDKVRQRSTMTICNIQNSVELKYQKCPEY